MGLNDTLSSEELKSFFEAAFSVFANQLQGKLEVLINLGKIVFVLVIIYVILLIISKVYRLRDSYNLNNISKNVIEINEKLDLLLSKKKPKKKTE